VPLLTVWTSNRRRTANGPVLSCVIPFQSWERPLAQAGLRWSLADDRPISQARAHPSIGLEAEHGKG
jgi:hypothetical protein